MSKNIYKSNKDVLKDFCYDDIAVEIGIYDNNNTLAILNLWSFGLSTSVLSRLSRFKVGLNVISNS